MNEINNIEYKLQTDNVLLKIFIDGGVIVNDILLTPSLHTHTFTEIFVCKNRKINIETINQTFTLHPGDIAIVPSEIMHILISDMDPNIEWVSIGIILSKCSSKSDIDLYSKLSLLTDQNNILIYKNRISLYEIIKNIHTTEKEENLLHIFSFISELIKISNIITNKRTITEENKKYKTKNIDILLKLDRIINYEFMQPLTNKIIANRLNISQRQLSRLILNSFDTTLHTLLTRKRISAATKLLLETSNTVEDIASSVGFNGKLNFYREFKKIYEITPAQYRKSHIYNK